MTFFPDGSTLMTIGGLSIRWYAVTLIAGIIAAYFLIADLMKDHGYGIDTTDEIMILCMIAGVLFGRAFWLIENLSEYLKYVPYMFAIGDGGFDILGVMAGAVIFMFFYTQVRHMSILRTLDIVLPAVLLFGIITRTGRAFEQPTVLILNGLDLIGFALLNYILRPYREGRRRGDLTALTLMWAGLTRVISLVFHLDTHAENSLLLTIGVELVGLILYYIVHNRRPTQPIILFDLDGTLMDSHQMVIQCFSYLFKKYGDIRDFTAEKQQEVFGPPLRDEMIKLFPDQDPDQMVAEYSDYQSTFSWSDEVSLFPHVKETLDVLWSEGYKLGVVSSRMTSSCELWLRQLGLAHCFGVVLGRDMYQLSKPAPDGILYAGKKLKRGHDSCIYIGDNVSDVQAAKAAGVFSVAFLSDPTIRAGIEAEQPNIIMTDMRELLDLLDENHEWAYERI